MIIGIGIDLAECNRVEKLLNKFDKAIKEIFTPAEIEYCGSKKFPAESFAARFAAKEAFLKAIGTGWGTAKSPKWREIETVIDTKAKGGAPQIKLSGKAKQIAEELGVKQIYFSLTHTKEYAAAVVVLEK